MKRLTLLLIALLFAAPVEAGIKYSYSPSSSSAGAPTDATYITQTANGDLSAEQALSSLSTGVVTVTTTTGVLDSVVPGTSGNVLTSNGTAWTSATPSAAGDITAVGGCTTGACFDGSTSSGTVLTFDHGTGTYGSDGTITFDGTNNKFTIKTSGITDTGSVYTPILALEPINTATNHPAWIQMDGLGSHDGTFRAGVDGNVVGFVAGRAGNSSGAGLSFYGTTVYPITITNNDGASPAISNGGVDLGSSSGRWNNVYSEAGNFTGQIYTTGEIQGASFLLSGPSGFPINLTSDVLIFNETGLNFSVRFEGDNDINAIFLKGSTDRVGFGTNSPTGKVSIDGRADENQLWVQGHSTQTNSLILAEKSDGTDVFTLSNDGAVVAASTTTTTDLILTKKTVAALGTATDQKVSLVSDALSITDCTTGGGSTYNLCVGNGSTWVDV
jgi:hypothetical protein